MDVENPLFAGMIPLGGPFGGAVLEFSTSRRRRRRALPISLGRGRYLAVGAFGSLDRGRLRCGDLPDADVAA
jgi:hypothetical protein